ncbi:hypothetical protein V6N12_003678 [Hibiscus sabdariffa]|uniref:Uncharacterized protein n=1 Tax=Hibiscus sabdariffa TaxID=183260 RepID=A0ABR2AMQ2_9ROSI
MQVASLLSVSSSTRQNPAAHTWFKALLYHPQLSHEDRTMLDKSGKAQQPATRVFTCEDSYRRLVIYGINRHIHINLNSLSYMDLPKNLTSCRPNLAHLVATKNLIAVLNQSITSVKDAFMHNITRIKQHATPSLP